MGFFRKKVEAPKPPEDDDDIQLSAFVLLAEPLVFTGNALVAALQEDFPKMEWGGGGFEEVMGDMPQNSNAAVISQVGIGPGLKAALINTMPGFDFIPSVELMEANRLPPEGMQSIRGAGSYLNVAVWAPKDDLALRVEAGRRLACIVSVLAGLPIARGVVWHPANRVVTAEQWGSLSGDLKEGGLPTFATTLLLFGGNHDYPGTVDARTVGLAAYIDAEIEMPRAPMEVPEAAQTLLTTAKMLTELGHVFEDGHTIGHSEDQEGSWRIRYRAAETHPTGVAHWTLVHPEAPFDHEEEFGPIPKRAAKKTVKSDFGWLKRHLGGGKVH